MLPLRVGPLVRATTATSFVIWAEFFQPGRVTLSATPFNTTEHNTITVTTPTVTVGGRHYAAPQLPGLLPATWYSYHIDISTATLEEDTPQASERFQEISPASLAQQCFRTLDTPAAYPEAPLRLAYGSCRDLNDQQVDALS